MCIWLQIVGCFSANKTDLGLIILLNSLQSHNNNKRKIWGHNLLKLGDFGLSDSSGLKAKCSALEPLFLNMTNCITLCACIFTLIILKEHSTPMSILFFSATNREQSYIISNHTIQSKGLAITANTSIQNIHAPPSKKKTRMYNMQKTSWTVVEANVTCHERLKCNLTLTSIFSRSSIFERDLTHFKVLLCFEYKLN